MPQLITGSKITVIIPLTKLVIASKRPYNGEKTTKKSMV